MGLPSTATQLSSGSITTYREKELPLDRIGIKDLVGTANHSLYKETAGSQALSYPRTAIAGAHLNTRSL